MNPILWLLLFILNGVSGDVEDPQEAGPTANPYG